MIINLLYLVTLITFRKRVFKDKKIYLPTTIFTVVLFIIFIYSSYQFNYVITPKDFFTSDLFYTNYDYNDLKDDVRIEYYARDFYGVDEIYRESYDKDEIKNFLEFFRNHEILPDSSYEDLGRPNVFRDWINDIHVMIRNMDEDNPNSGYYVFSIDIVDTSDYVLKYYSNDIVYIYKLPDGLKEFVLEHLYK